MKGFGEIQLENREFFNGGTEGSNPSLSEVENGMARGKGRFGNGEIEVRF